MNLSLADKIAQAVLYEGYILYPYRPDTFKNRQRWTFGGLFPRDYSPSERSTAQTECLLAGRKDATLDFRVRFLHLQDRLVGSLLQPVTHWDPDNLPGHCQVDSLLVGERTIYGWQEAVERDVAFSDVPLAELLAGPRQFDFSFPAWQAAEPVQSETGEIAGVIVRQRQAVQGRLEVRAEPAPPADDSTTTPVKLTVRVHNLTALDAARGLTRDQAAAWSLASTHVLLGIHGGQFISVVDPPAAYRSLAESCHQDGLWPVLVGDEGENDLLLASPIILDEHPQIAPESPGDLFDSAEIDEILTLRILAMTDAEKAAMRAVDERSRALLERTEALSDENRARLHGAVRGLRPLEQDHD